jgi:hypothetical protein
VDDDVMLNVTVDHLECNDLFAQLVGWYRADLPAFEDWAKQAEEDFAFVAGHQWSDEEIAALKELDRTPLTFDRIGPIVATVLGIETNNREEMIAKPRGVEDSTVAEAESALLRWAREQDPNDEGNAEDAESEAFEHQIVAGMGWIEQRLADDDSGALVAFACIDPMEMRWQAGAKKRNLADARRFHRAREIEAQDALAMFPGKTIDEINASWAKTSPVETRTHNRDPQAAYTKENAVTAPTQLTTVTVIETQWTQKVTLYQALNPTTGEYEDVSPALRTKLAARGIDIEPVASREITFRAYIGSRDVLQVHPLPVQGAGSLYKCATGKYDRKKKVFYGIVRAAKDPQRYGNKWRAMSVEIMAAGSKGSAPMIEETAFGEYMKAEDFEEAWADTRAPIILGEGGLNKVRERPAVQYPVGYDRLTQSADDAVRSVMGVNLEAMGQQIQNQAGVLEYQRKQAVVSSLGWAFDNLRRMKRQGARLTMKFIAKFMDEPMMVRILGPQAQEMTTIQGMTVLQALQQPGVLDADIVLDENPASPNAKERNWQAIAPLLPLVQQAPADVQAAVVRYSPLPGAVAEKWALHLEESAKAAPKPNPMEDATLKKITADTMAQVAKAHKTAAETREIQADVDLEPAKVAIDAAAEIRRRPENLPRML